MNNTITERRNTIGGINRLDEVENQISDLEDKVTLNIHSKQQQYEKESKQRRIV